MNEYQIYVVQPDDSAYGIGLKFDISSSELLLMNDKSECSLYAGMQLKIPLRKQSDEYSQSCCSPRTRDDLLFQPSKTTQFFDVSFVTQCQVIRGQITILQEILFFDPHSQEHQKSHQLQILFCQVKKIDILTLKPHFDLSKNRIQQDKMIKMIVHTNKPKYLLFHSENADEAHQLMEQLNIIWSTQQKNCNNKLKSVVKHYIKDHESIDYTIEKLFAERLYLLSTMKDKSNIINYQDLLQLSLHFPAVFQEKEWMLKFSTIRDGSLMKTAIRKCKYGEPCLLIIKDFDGQIFGAYLSEGVHISRDEFYGCSQTFLFKKDHDKVLTFHWTKKNRYFTFCDDSEGLGIGCNDKYGLYINGELTSGYSHYCDTFDNDQLSNKPDFQIEILEIWEMNH